MNKIFPFFCGVPALGLLWVAFPACTCQQPSRKSPLWALGTLRAARGLDPQHSWDMQLHPPHCLPAFLLLGSSGWGENAFLGCQVNLHSQFALSCATCTHCLPRESPHLWFQSPPAPCSHLGERVSPALLSKNAGGASPSWHSAHRFLSQVTACPGNARHQHVQGTRLGGCVSGPPGPSCCPPRSAYWVIPSAPPSSPSKLVTPLAIFLFFPIKIFSKEEHNSGHVHIPVKLQ